MRQHLQCTQAAGDKAELDRLLSFTYKISFLSPTTKVLSLNVPDFSGSLG